MKPVEQNSPRTGGTPAVEASTAAAGAANPTAATGTTPATTAPSRPQTRIGRRLTELRAQGRKALVVYLTAGDPDLETSLALVQAVAEAGADVVELGLPYSDPLADGPVIQAATLRALRAGTTPQKVLELAGQVRAAGQEVPLAIMSYVNPILHMGYDPFCRAAAAAGVDGLIIPDVPHEESADLRQTVQAHGLDWIPLAAPTSSPERVAALAREAGGFVYCVSLTGVTGARESLSDRFVPLVHEVRRHTQLPVAVGFGISTPQQAAQVAQVADAVIVGSALVRLCGEGGSRDELLRRARAFVGELKAALS